MSTQAFPLDWPPGWKRTQTRTRAKFVGRRGQWGDGESGQRQYRNQKPLTIEQATTRVVDELRRFGVPERDILISSNLQLRLDGWPRSNQANPADPGVAVYWTRPGDKGQRCMAIDRYDRVADNLAAIAATLEAMRAIERHGGAAILDRAFAGFKSLPAPEQAWNVLGIPAAADRERIEDAYRRLAAQHHPDRPGGDEQTMAKINWARDWMLERFV